MMTNFASYLKPMNLNNPMPDESRVWIYQADREFTAAESDELKKRAGEFVKRWTSHSKLVKAGFELRYNRFLILILDESHVAAGGCSIDSSVHFIRELETEFNNPMTDRMKFAFRQGDQVKNVTRKEFEQLLSQGIISDHTLVFNNLVSTVRELNSGWEVEFGKSWHKQFFTSNV